MMQRVHDNESVQEKNATSPEVLPLLLPKVSPPASSATQPSPWYPSPPNIPPRTGRAMAHRALAPRTFATGLKVHVPRRVQHLNNRHFRFQVLDVNKVRHSYFPRTTLRRNRRRGHIVQTRGRPRPRAGRITSAGLLLPYRRPPYPHNATLNMRLAQRCIYNE